MNVPELREVPGYAGRYFASDDGRIWSAPHAWATGAGGYIKRSHNGMWMRTLDGTGGYAMVNLALNGKKRSIKLHRVIALTWHANPEGKTEVNHINGIKSDNRPANLEWCTSSENKLHAFATGLSTESVRTNIAAAREARASRRQSGNQPNTN